MRHFRRRRRFKRLFRTSTAAFVFLIAAVGTFSLISRPVKLSFAPTPETIRHPKEAAGVPNYARDEVDTFYTFPEWYIVWSYQAKADFQRSHLPAAYSYFGDIGQFWQAYSRMYAATRRVYPFAGGDHVMLAVIGSSFTVEYALKALYEKTVGRFSEWTSGGNVIAEDEYAASVAEDYASFVHLRPFYEFSFLHALKGLWRVPFHTTHLLRAIERRGWLSLDYAVESAYCELIEQATHASYGYEEAKTAVWLDFPAPIGSDGLGSLKVVRQLSPESAIVELPRYQPFTDSVHSLVNGGACFRQIAGNQLIVASYLAHAAWRNSDARLQTLLTQPMLSQRDRIRVVLLGRVNELDQTLPALEKQGLVLEHLYDY